MPNFKSIFLLQLLANGLLQGAAIPSKKEEISVLDLTATLEKPGCRGRTITYVEAPFRIYNSQIKGNYVIQPVVKSDPDRFLFTPWISQFESDLLRAFTMQKVRIGEIEINGVLINSHLSEVGCNFMQYVEATLATTYEAETAKKAREYSKKTGEMRETEEFQRYKLLWLKTRYYTLYAHCFPALRQSLFPSFDRYSLIKVIEESADVLLQPNGLLRTLSDLITSYAFDQNDCSKELQRACEENLYALLEYDRLPSSLSKLIYSFIDDVIIIENTEIVLDGNILRDGYSKSIRQWFLDEPLRLKQAFKLWDKDDTFSVRPDFSLQHCTISYFVYYHPTFRIQNTLIEDSTFCCIYSGVQLTQPLTLQLENSTILQCTVSARNEADEGAHLHSLEPLVAASKEVGASGFFEMTCRLPTTLDWHNLEKEEKKQGFELPMCVEYRDTDESGSLSTLMVFHPEPFFQIGKEQIEEGRLSFPQVEYLDGAWYYQNLIILVGDPDYKPKIPLDNQHIRDSEIPRLSMFTGSFSLSRCQIKDSIPYFQLDWDLWIFQQKFEEEESLYWVCSEDQLSKLASSISNSQIKLRWSRHKRELAPSIDDEKDDPEVYFTEQVRSDQAIIPARLQEVGFTEEQIDNVTEELYICMLSSSVYAWPVENTSCLPLLKKDAEYLEVNSITSLKRIMGTPFYRCNEEDELILSHLFLAFSTAEFVIFFNEAIKDKKITITNCIFAID